ncbi:uncharacterized protein LOC118183186 [Stegodyphus dumicola]|uniref:uncharacterized protein LOC118183186 n=1 Tax=Stegodyphus dumicola TaxID=202533 RepID=UPI0015AEF6FB|nr:uncharacterized protein LOC118183186 [Stegodyphus dumicola]
MTVLFLLLVSWCHLIFCEDLSSRCSPWVTIEEELKRRDNHVNCIKNENCTGMNCSGNSNGYDVHGGILINSCENPPSIEFFVDIPNLYVNNWKRKFYHGDSFTLTSNLGGELELQKEKNKLILGLFLHVIYGKNGTHPLFPLLHFPVKFPVFQNAVFTVPGCLAFEDHVTQDRISVTLLPSTKSSVLTSRGKI